VAKVEVAERGYKMHRTLARFHSDKTSFVRGVRGPFGSGKSTAMCWELLFRALEQAPASDGVRRTRFAVVRNTYRELLDTTLKTWINIFPPNIFGHFNKNDMVYHLRQGDLDMEVLFRALDRPEDMKKLLSLDITGAWANEAREIPLEIIEGLGARVGRYPSVADGGCSWRGIVMDTNPPDDDHWWYRLAEEERPQGWRFWAQPPALVRGKDCWLPNLAAENIQFLDGGYDYYYRQLPGKTDEWIKVYVLGEYGTIQAGKPVYTEYNDSIHCAKDPLEPYISLPLQLSWDFGLTPAVIFSQLSPRGQLRVIDELCATDMGIRQFVRDVVRPHIAAHYAGLALRSVGDPAGAQRAQSNESTCMEELAAADLPTLPARTNAFLARREAVAGFLTRMTDGQPGFLLSPTCQRLRRGFLGGYHYRRIQVSGERYTDEPEKNQYSHPHDALQYAALEVDQSPTTQKRHAQTPARVNWR